MRALVYEAPRTMTMRDVQRPVPSAGEVLMQVAYSGICGSELSGFLGQSSIRTPPLVFGHELSGFVAEIGPDTDCPVPLRAQVTVNPLVSCGRCSYCVTARAHLCRTRRLLGAAMPGGNAEYVPVPVANLEAVPENMPLREASMTEPAACAIHAVALSSVGPADSALVVGAGPIGLFIVQVLRTYGVGTIIVADRNTDRLRMAEACGALPIAHHHDEMKADIDRLTDGAGVGVSFDAAGTVETRLSCLESTAPGGKVMFIGLHTDHTPLPVNTVVRSEIAMHGVFAYAPEEFRTALRWLADGRIGLVDGVVDTDLADGQNWYQRLVDGDATAKVLLRPGPPLDETGAGQRV